MISRKALASGYDGLDNHLASAYWHSLSVRTNVFVAERREPPGEYPSDLPMVTGQLALFRYKVSAIWLAPFG